jgi:5,10-methylenetetrahydrofolate reductase
VLTSAEDFLRIAEVNPPELPNMSHLLLDGAWENVLVTDNVFGRIRVSPYAFSARLTHDTPSVTPTVVVSTRDRNILAIESEVRGALGNGVKSFLVVVGDTMPQVDHLADHLEVVRHLRNLQSSLPDFEVGMPTRLLAWHKKRRIEAGAQFLFAGPILDPSTVKERLDLLDIRPEDPPVFLMTIPPFSTRWVKRMEALGAVPCGSRLKQQLDDATSDADRRAMGWEASKQVAEVAKGEGIAGVIVMGISYETVIDEAALVWSERGRLASRSSDRP